MTLIVRSPDIIGFIRGGLGASGMGTPNASFTRGNESFPCEDISSGGDGGQLLVMGGNDLEELLRPPGGMFHPCLHDGLNDGGICFVGTVMGSSCSVGQAFGPLFLISLNPLIAGLPADTELKA